MNSPVLRARDLRGRMSQAEGLLWACLRRNSLGGLHFRRQHPAPPFTLDFYCAAARLAVEVDGAQHSSEGQARHDALRDQVLGERGIATLRVAAVDVMNELEGVLVRIEQTARQRIRPKAPSVGSADISPASGRET